MLRGFKGKALDVQVWWNATQQGADKSKGVSQMQVCGDKSVFRLSPPPQPKLRAKSYEELREAQMHKSRL